MKLLLTVLAFCGITCAAAPRNAALDYWQAFATLPPIDEAFEERLREWRTMDLEEPMGAFEVVAGPMAFAHRAAKTAECDWGIDWSDGYATLLPHFGKARTLARVACLRARFYVMNGRTREAIDDFCAAMAVARHSGDAAIIGKLVHISIESDAITGLADHMGSFSPDDLAYLESRLALLPPSPSLKSALQREQLSLLEELDKAQVVDMQEACRWGAQFNGVLDNLDEVKLRRVLEIFTRISDADYAQARQFVILPPSREEAEQLMRQLLDLEAVRSGEQIVKLDGTIGLDPDAPDSGGKKNDVADCKALLQRAVALSELPFPEMLAQADAIDAHIAEAPAMARDVLANIGSVTRRHVGCELRKLMLEAAIAVLCDGKTALERFKDPVTGEPFMLAGEGDSLILASSFNDGRGPVELTIARSTERAPALEIPAYMSKALRDLRQLRAGQDPGADAQARAAYDKFRQDIEKRVDTVLRHLDQNEDDKRDAMIRLLLDGAFDFVEIWEGKIADAIDGDHSAFVASAIVLRAPDIEASIIHHALQKGRSELDGIIGKPAAEELIYLVDERRRGRQ
jgi:hypothetical protein